MSNNVVHFNGDRDTRAMMSEAKFFEGYSRWDDKKGRYETWNEAVERVMGMHRKFYSEKMSNELSELITEAEFAYKEKYILGAQRALQFGGEQLLKHHLRLYNCTSTYADRAEFFGEMFFALLCGSGVGVSVQKHHVAKLPKIQNRQKQAKIHAVTDDIEGWATAADVLLSSYFVGGGKHPEYEGRRVYFDTNAIRGKGSFISGGFKAPGPEPLRRALDKIEHLLQGLILQGVTELRPIHVYDICMFMADAVLAGGVRRSATIFLFSLEDDEMMKAKTGNWFEENPQRARSNNSVVIIRDEISRERFAEILKFVKEFGEPGFAFFSSREHCTNPCFTGDTIVAVADGRNAVTIKELAETGGKFPVYSARRSKSNNKSGAWITEVKTARAFTTGIKPTVEVVLSDGSSFTCTDNHKLALSIGGYVEAKNAVGKILEGFFTEEPVTNVIEELPYQNPVVVSVNITGDVERVYDLEVDDNHNFYIITGGDKDHKNSSGVLVHNCFEIGMFPQYDGKSGFQGCNLTEINGAKANSKEEFFKACRAASILGTLQAGYTDFKFMSDITKKIFEREALLGVSVTGWMNNPDVLLNEETLREGAELVKTINRQVAGLIGINPAARTTTTKPAGNACSTFDTKIRTENGIMSLLEIFDHCTNRQIDMRTDNVGDDTSIQVINELRVYDENNDLREISGLYVNGMARIYEIEFEDGNIYKFTDHHKLKTTGGWKLVCELTEEDIIESF